MTVLAYTLTPLARISAGRTGEVHQARSIHRVLPGTTIRGSLGHTWWRSPDHAFDPRATTRARQDAFDRLFGRALVVRAAVPAGGDAEFRATSMVSLKYSGQQPASLSGFLDLAAGPVTACPACGAPFDAPRGWTPLEPSGAGRPLDRCHACDAIFEHAKDGWYVPESAEVASTRTQLTEDGIAADENLFTRSALDRSLTFRGTVEVREGVAVPAEAIAWLRHELAFNVGGQRSILGRVQWRTEEWQPDPIPTSTRVVLQVRSPALLVDERGLASLDLAGHLARIPGAGRLACRPWVRTTQVSGWHSIAGIPKPLEWAVAAGSTAVLEDWSPEALTRLVRGIGVRQLEGYGEVALRAPDDLARFGHPAGERLLNAAPVRATEASEPAPPPAVTAPTAPAPPAVTAPPAPPAAPVRAPVAPQPVAAPRPRPAPPPPPTPATLAAKGDDPVARFIAALPPEKRTRSVNGLLGAARNISTKRDLGTPASMIDSAIQLTLTCPWAKELLPEARRLVQEILRSEHLRDHITNLDAGSTS